MVNNSKDIQGGLFLRMGQKYKRYKEKGLFRFIGRNVVLIILVYVMLVALIMLTGHYLLDYNTMLRNLVASISDQSVIILFFASESFTGMVPVDLFVIWTQKFSNPLPYLALLGVLSYLGGIISYRVGIWIAGWPRVRAYTERRLSSYFGMVRKWGGAFIVIAALFPFTPFSLVVMAVSILKYPFRLFLLFATARLARFVIQGVLFFNILHMHQWLI